MGLVSLLGTAEAGDSCGMMSPKQSGAWAGPGTAWSSAGVGAAVPFPKGDGFSTGSLHTSRCGSCWEPWGTPGSALCMLEALRFCEGQDFGEAVAAAGQEADVELLLNILPFASCFIRIGVQGTVSPRGKKCPEIPQTLQYGFCFTARQKGALCVRAERNSPVPQPPQKLNVNYLPPCAFT